MYWAAMCAHTGVSVHKGEGQETEPLYSLEMSPVSARTWVFCLMRQNVKQGRGVGDSDKKSVISQSS